MAAGRRGSRFGQIVAIGAIVTINVVAAPANAQTRQKQPLTPAQMAVQVVKDVGADGLAFSDYEFILSYRRLSNGEQVNRVVGRALTRRPSVDFSSYWQEYIQEQNRP